MSFVGPASRLKPNVRPARHAAVNKRTLQEFIDEAQFGSGIGTLNLTEGVTVSLKVQGHRAIFDTGGGLRPILIINRHRPALRAWIMGSGSSGTGGMTSGWPTISGKVVKTLVGGGGGGSVTGSWLFYIPGGPLGHSLDAAATYGNNLDALVFDRLWLADLSLPSPAGFGVIQGQNMRGTNSTLTIDFGAAASRTLSGNNTGDQDLSSYATLASSLVPKAIYKATITPTLLTGNISSVSGNVITWSSDLAAQGVVTGDTIIPSVGGTWPTGLTTRGAVYINLNSSTTFTAHLTLAAALAGTSPIALTGAGSGTRTMHKLVHSATGPNSGFSSVSPVGGSGTYETNIGFALNFTAVADANFAVELIQSGLVTGGTVFGATGMTPVPGATTPTTAIFRGGQNAIPVNNGGVISQPTTWALQGTTAFTISAWIWR